MLGGDLLFTRTARGTNHGTSAGVFWQSRRHRPGYHSCTDQCGHCTAGTMELGAESSHGVVALAASMKDENGRVLVDGFYTTQRRSARSRGKHWQTCRTMTRTGARAGHCEPEGGGKKLVELLMSLRSNVRGLRSAYVGEHAPERVPEKAEASIDARMVKGKTPRKNSSRSPRSFGSKGST